MIYAILLFALTYILMLVLPKHRVWVTLASGLVFILTGMLKIGDIFSVIDLNVLLMIGGTMGLVQLFIDSRMPQRMADRIMNTVSNVRWAAVALSLFSGAISALVDNVATVLMVAPVAMAICKKQKLDPIPVIISIAVSSNLQGAATLVGDTTAIMLGSALDMSFMDFFWFHSRPSIFFAVEIGAIFSACIVYVLFREETAPLSKTRTLTKVTDYVPTVLLLLMIVLLVCASFAPDDWQLPKETNGLIACAVLLIGLIYNLCRNRSLDALVSPLKAIDFETLGLLTGLFLVIGGVEHMGVIDALANLLVRLGGGSLFLMYTVIAIASVVISAFIDNIPYVATMIPIISGISARTGMDPTPLYFILLSAATLGGNCTPIGASANITGIGILRKEGYEVRNRDFFRIGIPFTIAAVLPAYIYIWVVYGI